MSLFNAGCLWLNADALCLIAMVISCLLTHSHILVNDTFSYYCPLSNDEAKIHLVLSHSQDFIFSVSCDEVQLANSEVS